MPRPTPSPTFVRRRRAGNAVVLFTVIVLDGKLAIRPCRNPLRSCEACTRGYIRPFLRTHASTRIPSDESADTARTRAGRPGRRKVGHRIQVTRRAPTQLSTASSGAGGRPAASRGRVMRGTLRTPLCGRRALAPAVLVGTAACPSRATSRRGAHFTPGGRIGRGIGRNGGRERRERGKAAIRSRRPSCDAT
jgi:hypothetical protein